MSDNGIIAGVSLRDARGKSGLNRTAHGVTPLHRKVRNSGTERMSMALIQESGTGDSWGADGVKTAKLCAEQDQIGKHYGVVRTLLPGRLLEAVSNGGPRGMIIVLQL